MTSKGTRRTRVPVNTPATITDSSTSSSAPLVFISHDHRDAAIAEAFELLLRDASAGFLRTFRSSARIGNTGIEYGREWYKSIMSNLQEARELVALITVNSLDRPWILYEAGVAAGRLEVPVLGVVLGVPLEKANVGPFAQFQNSTDDEEALTGLLHQLVTRNSSASPRPEAIRIHVQAFRNNLVSLPHATLAPVKPARSEDLVPRLFEEVKTMFREILLRLETTTPHLTARGSLTRFHEVLRELEMLPPTKRFVHYPQLLAALIEDQPDAISLVRTLFEPIPVGAPQDSLAKALELAEQALKDTPHRMLAADDREEWHHALSHIQNYLRGCKEPRGGGISKPPEEGVTDREAARTAPNPPLHRTLTAPARGRRR